MEYTSEGLVPSASATIGEAARFLTKKYRATAPAMTTATMEQLTAIPIVAFLSRPDECLLLVAAAAVAVLSLVDVTGEVAEVVAVFEVVTVFDDDVIRLELVEIASSRMLAMRFP